MKPSRILHQITTLPPDRSAVVPPTAKKGAISILLHLSNRSGCFCRFSTSTGRDFLSRRPAAAVRPLLRPIEVCFPLPCSVDGARLLSMSSAGWLTRGWPDCVKFTTNLIYKFDTDMRETTPSWLTPSHISTPELMTIMSSQLVWPFSSSQCFI